MAKLVSALVSAVKERASLPANNDRFTDSNIVELLRQELEETVVPFMNGLTEEFFVFRQVVELLDDAGAAKFPDLKLPIPTRAYARVLRDIQYLDTAGNRYNIPSVYPEDKDLYNSTSTSAPAGFYFENDSVILVGSSSTLTGSVEFSFYYKVPTLVSSDELYASISNISYNSTTGDTTITADSTDTPSGEGLTLSGVGLFDIFRKSSGAYTRLSLNATAAGTGTSTTFVTDELTADDVTTIKQAQNGGYPVAAPYTEELLILASDVTPFSPIPAELDNFLVSATCGRILEALGDTEGLNVNMAVMNKIKDNLTMVYGKRIAGEAKKATNKRGIYNSMRRRGSFGWF